ncbi:hypothetical protein H4C75_14380 [Pseudomonas mosselii]|uniref:Uncharacterized protein n=2 Tax=Pseudomonas mosselii TaxID=78327 RepID=A0A7W2PYY8_9PSED|nr:hypothetical protein [Pseudomonas mosselii]
MKTLLALNTDLSAMPLAEGQAPQWVELIPTGPYVRGLDGREWLFNEGSQQLVLSTFTGRGIDLVIDWEHATQHRAPVGEAAPASGWIKQLEIREGALWGNVAWTPAADAQITTRQYRFLSPVFDYIESTGQIVRLVSAGLTNTPNFTMTALNQEGQPQEFTDVKFPAALLALFGLAESATEDQVVAAATNLKQTAQAANAEKSDITRFIPRADYDRLEARATNAEQQLATLQKAEHNKAVDAEIQSALTTGKITPATADYYRATCSEQSGLERFREFVKAAPAVADPSGLGNDQPPKTSTALNAEQQAACAQLGLSQAEYAKTLKPEA